jgi:hypothetical protein
MTESPSLKEFFKNLISRGFDVPPIPPGSAGFGFKSRTQNLPNGGGTYQSPVPGKSPVYGSPDYMSPDVPIYSRYGQSGSSDLATPAATTTPPPAPTGTGGGSSGRVFSGGGAAAPAPSAPLDMSQYKDRINPATGRLYTPKEYADVIAKRAGGGTVPGYAGDAITNPGMSAADLTRRARTMNNERNDIAVGATDPYGVASQSGLQYSPAELSAIEKAYSGVYDPALNDVFAKLEAKNKEDALKAQEERDKNKSDRDLANALTLEDAKYRHDSALKSVSTGDYNLSSKQQTALLNITNKYSSDATINQGLQAIQIKNLTKAINDNPGSSGNQLIALYTLVKNLDPNSAVREGELDLAQKTNSYLGKFGDSLTRISEGRILNPTALKELTAATDLLANEWTKTAQRRQQQFKSQASVFGLDEPFNDYIGGYENPDTISSSTDNGVIPAGTDGTAYGFPGYVSDGTQWIEK